MENRHVPRTTLVIRTVAGGYLIYLAYQLLSGLKEGGSMNPAISIGGAVLFVIAGGIMMFFSLRALKKGEYMEADMKEETEEEAKAEMEENQE